MKKIRLKIFIFALILLLNTGILYAANKEAEKHYKLGVKSIEKRDYEISLKEFNAALKIDPNYVDAFYGRGTLYYIQGKLEDSLKDFLKAIAINPKYWKAYDNIGNVYWDMKKYDESLEYYEKAVKLNPPIGLPYYNAGSTCASFGQYDKAIEYLKKGIAVDPKNAELYSELGYALYQTQETDKAIENLKKAIKLDANYSIPYFTLGRIYENKAIELDEIAGETNKKEDYEKAFNQYQESLKYLKKSVELEPNNYRYRFQLGNIYFGIIEDDKALEEYRVAMDLARQENDDEIVKMIQKQIKLIQELKEKREKQKLERGNK
jgi:tetratricopeptide (TPR) repeat protein